MFGSTNEYLIFPIIDLVNREIKRNIDSGALDRAINAASTRGTPEVTNTRNETEINYGNILSVLESNDFDMTLEKNDISNPNMLTGVSILFGKTIKELISLVRENNKLKYVKISVIKRESISEVTSNPFGMSGTDFVEYVMNKRKWIYYKEIENDLTKTQEERDDATANINALELRNIDLRNIYAVDERNDMSYDALVKYLPNPCGMDKYDYVEYMKNKRIGAKEYQPADVITDEMVVQAKKDNDKLRAKYFIGDIFSYEELKSHLPNPPGMHDDDYVTYIVNKVDWTTTKDDITAKQAEVDAETDPIIKAELQTELDLLLDHKTALEEVNAKLRLKYFAYPAGVITGYDESDLEFLKRYLPKDDSLYDEKVLFKIIISLIYNSEGKLINVKSETVKGG